MAKKQEAKTENKTVEISKEILTQIEELKNNKQILIQELGEISIAEITLEERRETAETFLSELKKMEKMVTETLQKDYGQGTVDLQNGTFTPFEKN